MSHFARPQKSRRVQIHDVFERTGLTLSDLVSVTPRKGRLKLRGTRFFYGVVGRSAQALRGDLRYRRRRRWTGSGRSFALLLASCTVRVIWNAKLMGVDTFAQGQTMRPFSSFVWRPHQSCVLVVKTHLRCREFWWEVDSRDYS